MKFLPRSILLAALAWLTTATVLHAAETDELLPVEQAFVVGAKALDRDTVRLDWKLAEHYYLYRERIKVTTADAGVALGAHELPEGEKKHDEFLGDVEVYHRDFSSKQKLNAPAGVAQITLAVRYQGCHEVAPKICYPPHTVKLAVDLPPAIAPTASDATNLLSGGGAGGALDTGEPLPVDKAYVFEAIATSPGEVLVRFTMPKGYYLYRDKTSFHADNASLGAPRWPEGKLHDDASFGKTTVYFDQVEVPIAVSGLAAGQPLRLTSTFQGCLEGSVCYPPTMRSLAVTMPADAAATDTGRGTSQQQTRPAASGGSLLAALFAALLGGLILNLMPCVLPVLSLKAISILEGGESPRHARKHVLWYAAGVLLSFVAVGLAVIALREAGLAYGWGYQLQQPLIVAILVYVIVAIGLSLSGVVQFGVGLTNAGQGLASHSGPAGDFFTGVLAVVVASPCTAPFMGSALAFAFASSTLTAFLVFIALGLGLALPFLLIGFVPALGKLLPKPGAWMETLKQLLAFPMYLTAAWLIWVLGNQRGVDAIGLVLVGVILLGLALWWFEHSRYANGAWRALALVALLLALPPLYAIARLDRPAAAQSTSTDHVAFSPARLDELRKSGKAVFVDVGADWCTTCKVNERAVLHTDAFRALLKRTDTTFMVADWTNPDPDIEAFLEKFHSVGVPLYVVFRKGEEGRALPTVLTQATVRDAIENADTQQRNAAP
ncbi:protein-disulfide reductase DsbD family protein [Rudaea sp.]|uniref:protein-disulfide reductase DsbD family protein n=1 Tax=Rudaea sp. TaxID=2136325 RepID=UPI00378434CB